MTKAQREAARGQLYRFALGPLGLRREELWTITNGELADMAEAWQYKRYLDRVLLAEQTAALINAQIPRGKPKVNVQDLTGVWYDGKAMSKEDVLDRIGEKQGRGARAWLNGAVNSLFSLAQTSPR